MDWRRPTRDLPMQVLNCVEAIADGGLVGDRTADKSRAGNKRQMTLVQAKPLEAIGKLLQRDAIDPAQLRRNLVVASINLNAHEGQRFRIDSALLEMSGDGHPCLKREG